ncbi:8-amino-7-oxononanoate synthase [Allosaccharopolyspora coralli]|uniref:8-amino-7-oxononanoate synthase n=1 Tax=Allosaccharopolyspora coralli TaxID=2665642 RepID=UPI001E5184EB|nr:8-amino-7-oxononanoate synthase [Allosaccharopolyspora coralli]
MSLTPQFPSPSSPTSSSDRPFDWVDDVAAQRRRAGLDREVRVREADDESLDLASNDYLGLSAHPVVRRAAADAALRWGAGSTGSRLVTGTTALHRELEVELADACGVEAALVFSSGYAANLAAVTALTGPDTLIVSDRHDHASLIDGCRLARSRTVVVDHGSPTAVDAALAAHGGPAMVLTESVFSVDGDSAPLCKLHAVCRAHGAGLLVDDAHGLGVLSPGGALPALDLGGAGDVVATATLSKALGSQGGVVLGPRRVIEHLTQTARTFIFDTGLAPACAAAALAALRLVRAEPDRCDRVRRVAERLHGRLTSAGLTVSTPGAAVIGIPASSPTAAAEWAQACRQRGVVVGCFRPPSVPDEASRLRLTARADLTDAALDRAVDTIVATARQRRRPQEVLPGGSCQRRSR